MSADKGHQFKVGDAVRVSLEDKSTRRVYLYDGYEGRVVAIRGEGGDASYLVDTDGVPRMQTVSFREWFARRDLHLGALAEDGNRPW